ncbi:Gfo/Idh/MocA family oxidoreductase [Streptomyces sp. Pv4-95]|uniref:Gfo/Idh/MocA family protein n=1 Tax=Streptomyces sp. Pv4-95 TaxID=3049543 RepID=UPI0038918CBC
MKRQAAVIGLGNQALDDHLPGLAGCQFATLAAVCDMDPAVAEKQADALGVPGYTDVHTMLRQERPDFAIVAVPHHAGREVVEACAASLVHVMKEKPLATTPEEARELAKTCQSLGVELMVTVQRRFNPVYLAALQLLEQIGDPFLVEGRYTFHCTDPAAGWRGQTALAGGGALMDMGYHLIDLLIWYLGLPDRLLAATSTAAAPGAVYDAEDTALVHLSYDSGLYGSLLISRSAGPKTERLAVTGPRGSVVVERGKVSRLAPSGEVLETLTRQPAWPAAAATQIDTFCRVLDKTRPNPSGVADHLPHAAFLAAAYASRTSGHPVAPKEYL